MSGEGPSIFRVQRWTLLGLSRVPGKVNYLVVDRSRQPGGRGSTLALCPLLTLEVLALNGGLPEVRHRLQELAAELEASSSPPPHNVPLPQRQMARSVLFHLGTG